MEALVRKAGLSLEKIEGSRENAKNIWAPARMMSCQIIKLLPPIRMIFLKANCLGFLCILFLVFQFLKNEERFS